MTINQSVALVRETYPDKTLWLLQKKSGKPNATLSEDHWLIGFFDESSLREGFPIQMTRLANKTNPEGKWGIFTSSPVVDFQVQGSGWRIQTENSIYELTQVTSVFDNFLKECEKIGFDPHEQ